MKYISILGSTGSIGTQALQIVRANPDLKVCALTGNSRIDLLKEQIIEFKPEMACVFDKDNAERLSTELFREYPEIYSSIKIYSGMEGLIKAAEWKKSDMVLTAVVGMVGIRPTMAAICAGKDIALANKETLVCAGEIIMKAAADNNVKIY
ncbi:MAG: 1-deoxy-D-xylulose-5-phosphate reductoisomerase, partial [Parasporobacterium sp.]|nr:1-deoxy-D-xylulose-5-phosphate reductoisomerase [Parasporobacterium sp.]